MDIVLRVLITLVIVVNCESLFAIENKIVDRYLGIYEITNFRRVAGGLTTDGMARKQIGTRVFLLRDRFQIRNTVIRNPAYRAEIIKLPTIEGDIASKEMTIFHGFRTERTEVLRILVFESPNNNEAYEKFEVLDKDTLVEMYDGMIFTLKRMA